MRVRKKEIPKDGGKVRILSIPSIRDRVVQGALKLILEPIFEADFQSGSYGYRPKRTAHEAVNRVAQAIVEEKTRIIDIDLSAYFDNVQHSLLLEKVIVVRYADDLVVGFQHRTEAEQFLKQFWERLAKFGLELHPDKTRLTEFGRFAARDRKERGEGKPETFTFLGFTH